MNAIYLILILVFAIGFGFNDGFAQSETNQVKTSTYSDLGITFNYPQNVNYYDNSFSRSLSDEEIFEGLKSDIAYFCDNYAKNTPKIECRNLKFSENKILKNTSFKFYLSEFSFEEKNVSKIEVVKSWIMLSPITPYDSIIFSGYLPDDYNVIINSMKNIYDDSVFVHKKIPINVFVVGNKLDESQINNIKNQLIKNTQPKFEETLRLLGIQYDIDYKIISVNEQNTQKIKEFLLSNFKHSDLLHYSILKSDEPMWIEDHHPEWISKNSNNELVFRYDYATIDAKLTGDFLYDTLIDGNYKGKNIVFLNFNLEDIPLLKNYEFESTEPSTGKKFRKIGLQGFGEISGMYFVDLYAVPWKEQIDQTKWGYSGNFPSMLDCENCLENTLKLHITEFVNYLATPYLLYDPGAYDKYIIDILFFNRPTGTTGLSQTTLEKFVNMDLIKNELSSLYPYAKFEIRYEFANKDSSSIPFEIREKLSKPKIGSFDSELPIFYFDSSTLSDVVIEWAENRKSSSNIFEKTTKIIPIIILIDNFGNRFVIIDGRAAGYAYPDKKDPTVSCCVLAVFNENDMWEKNIGATDLLLHEAGHFLGLPHTFSSINGTKDFTENNFWNQHTSPMTYSNPLGPNCNYLSNFYNNDLQIGNKKFDLNFKNPCGIVNTKFTEIEKDSLADYRVLIQIQKAREKIQLNELNWKNDKDDELKKLVSAAIYEFEKGNLEQSYLYAVQANKGSQILISDTNTSSQLIPTGSIILEQYGDNQIEYVLYLNKNTIEKNSPVKLTFKGKYFAGPAYYTLNVFDIEIFSHADYKKYGYAVGNLGDGSFEFTKIFDNSFPPGKYTFSIGNHEIPFTLHSFVNVQKPNLPDWIKNNAKWWSSGIVKDQEFLNGIKYLIKEKIIIIQRDMPTENSSLEIPSWIKNNAKWWADGAIDDADFMKGIQYLVNSGIIKVN